MSNYLIIDGYNAISKIRQFNARKDVSLEASRLTFIKTLSDSLGAKGTFDKIVIVFDGKKQELGSNRETYGKIEAVFTANGKDADSVIVDILRMRPPKDRMTVCSDDNFVTNHTRAFGADAMTVKKLEELIILKKGLFKGRILEKDLGEDKLADITREMKKHWGVE
ncbi:MAG: NYN domain-containing protein [Candidatus Omnitrophota bacterium]